MTPKSPKNWLEELEECDREAAALLIEANKAALSRAEELLGRLKKFVSEMKELLASAEDLFDRLDE